MANLTTTPSQPRTKSLGDPNAAYESVKALWEKSRAVLNGQAHARAYDDVVDTASYDNLLLPFSPTMSQAQYNFYRAEGELPGLTACYARVLLGGLLRKPATIELPEDMPEDCEEWIRNYFGADGTSLHSFLDAAIWEELQTSRAWVIVDHPEVPNPDALSIEELKTISPYAMVVKAENVINWRKGQSKTNNRQVLSSLLVRYYTEDYEKNEFHPDLVDTVNHYFLDQSGLLVINTYQKRNTTETIKVINGTVTPNYQQDNAQQVWEKVRSAVPLKGGERMDFIPAWPLNGQIDPVEPILQPLIDREIALYNKVSRRNHLLYGAATYTPVVASDMTDEEFDEIVSAGLGSWIKIRQGDEIKALETPTSALADMERSINATIEEMARMGIRMLSPEGSSGESGVSLEIRNASQTAQLGMLNTKVSETLRSVIATMISWKYGLDFETSDIEFTLSADFNPTPIGADWMRLVTEWYQQGIIPRSTFIGIAKFNDILPAEYDDADGVEEIQSDPLIDNRATMIDASIADGGTTDRLSNGQQGQPQSMVEPPEPEFKLQSCPMALQDPEINFQNHMITIKDQNLGPADPTKPETVFWMKKAEYWKVDQATARERICGNCRHYIATPEMQQCIDKGAGGKILASSLPMEPKWADVEAPQAFCNEFMITCTSTRTCDDWEAGGPITDPAMIVKE